MSATASRPPADSAILRARRSEDVVVGDEIVRHRLATRAIHWTVALFFFLALFSGLPIWTPVFGWMAHLFGGLNVCRWLHPWAGLAFFVSMLVMFVHWLGEMRLEPNDREWLRPRKMIEYMRYQGEDPDVGKYNGGQKLFFFAAALGVAVGCAGFASPVAPSPRAARASRAWPSSTLEAAALASIPAAFSAARTSLLVSPCCLAIS